MGFGNWQGGSGNNDYDEHDQRNEEAAYNRSTERDDFANFDPKRYLRAREPYQDDPPANAAFDPYRADPQARPPAAPPSNRGRANRPAGNRPTANLRESGQNRYGRRVSADMPNEDAPQGGGLFQSGLGLLFGFNPQVRRWLLTAIGCSLLSFVIGICGFAFGIWALLNRGQ
jgi:hypothetical protein